MNTVITDLFVPCQHKSPYDPIHGRRVTALGVFSNREAAWRFGAASQRPFDIDVWTVEGDVEQSDTVYALTDNNDSFAGIYSAYGDSLNAARRIDRIKPMEIR